MKKSIIPILSVVLLVLCVACNPHSEDIAEYKYFAKEQITSYVQKSGFHKEKDKYIYEILDECVEQIELSNSKEKIDATVNSGKEKIIKTYKDFVKNQIISQTQRFYYNDELLEAMDEIKDNSISQIESANDKKEIDLKMYSALKEIYKQIKEVMKFDKSIEFESKRYDEKLHVETPQNIIIRSIEEMEKFLEDYKISEENRSAFENYDKDFFNKYALIFSLYWESGGNISRRVENIYISGEKVYIEIMGIVSEEDFTSEGYVVLNEDVEFRFYIIKIKQSDIENIKDVELFSTFTGEENQGDEIQDYVLKIAADKQVYAKDEDIVIDITLENRSGADVEIAYYLLFYPESSTGQFPEIELAPVTTELAPVTTKRLFKNGNTIHETARLGGCFLVGHHELKYRAVFYLTWKMTEFGYETGDNGVEVWSNVIKFAVN